MRGILASAAVLSASVLAGAAVVLLPSISQTTVADQSSVCIPANVNEPTVMATPEQRACLTDILLKALKTDKIQELLPVLQDLDRRAQSTCHLSTHEAGEAALPSTYGAQLAMIQRSAQSVCNSGLLHGIFTAVGKTGLTASEWEDITAWCDTFDVSSAPNIANCGDAIGHAVWYQYHDATQAIKVCATLSRKVWREECSEGIIMQHFAPVDAKRIPEPLPRDTSELCNHTEILDVTGLHRGCIRGVGYSASIQTLLKQGSTPSLRIPKEAYLKGLSYCLQYSKEDVNTCQERFIEAARGRFTFSEINMAVEILCPLTKIEQRCAEILLRVRATDPKTS